MVQLPVEQPGGGEQQSKLASLTVTTLSATLALGGGGVGTGTTMSRAAVEVDGRLQGEGAIEGSYRDYKAGTLPLRIYSYPMPFCQDPSTCPDVSVPHHLPLSNQCTPTVL